MSKKEKQEKRIILPATRRWWNYGLKDYMGMCIGDNDIVKTYSGDEYTLVSVGDSVCLKPKNPKEIAEIAKAKYFSPKQYMQLNNGEIIEFEFSTECKDSQGVEIFENDIIEYKIKGRKAKKPYRDIVIIDIEIPCFRTKRLGKNAFCFGKSLYDKVESIKVIGNIHEHPHLVPYKKRQENEDKQRMVSKGYDFQSKPISKYCQHCQHCQQHLLFERTNNESA